MEYGNHEQLHHGGNINNNSFISLLQPLVLSAFSLSLLLLLISLSWKTAKYLRFCLYKLLITNVLALCVASCNQWRNLRLYCYHTSQPFVCMCVCVFHIHAHIFVYTGHFLWLQFGQEKGLSLQCRRLWSYGLSFLWHSAWLLWSR